MKKCSMQKKKESLAKKNEKLFMLYDIHHNYPDFGKMSCWRNPQFWKDYEDYYSKAYPTMGIKITMKDNDSVDVTSNGKFIMNYSWKNGRHRATAEDGSGFKHPGFGFRDDLSMIYRGATGKEMGPYNAVYVDESKKQESVFDEIDPSYMLAQTFDEILSHTNDEIVISDSGVAKALGKYAIDDAFHVTDARNEDEFVDEATSILSGSPLDGSPFTASDAEDYARELWNA